jgi:hypothetical protein
MAWEQPGFCITLAAAADLTAKQFTFVKLDSNGRAAAVTSATDRPIGILQNKPDALDVEANVMILGVSKISADGALSLADPLGTSADGQAVAKTGQGTDGWLFGICLEASATAGDIVTGLFNFCPYPAALPT